MDTSLGILRGRPYGGLGVLWRKSLGDSCQVNLLDDDRIMHVKLEYGSASIDLYNVYLPYDSGSNVCILID